MATEGTVRVRTQKSPRKMLTDVVTAGRFISKYRQDQYGQLIGDWAAGSPILYGNLLATPTFTRWKTTMDEVHKGPPWRTGGPFASIEIRYPGLKPAEGPMGHISSSMLGRNPFNGTMEEQSRVEMDTFYPDAYEFGGLWSPFLPGAVPSFKAEDGWLPSMSDLRDRAWHAARPKLESAGTYVFVKEAEDIPRMLKTTSEGFHDIWKSVGGNQSSPIMQPKKIADHYINQNFGWAPFLNDMKSFYSTYQNTKDLIQRLTDENGREIHRRVTLYDKDETNIIREVNPPVGQVAYGAPGLPTPLPNAYWDNPPSWVLSERTRSTAQAIGRFKFYRPEFDAIRADYDSLFNQVRRYMTIYGLRISPSNIYKATPWTWLIDWFSSIGARIEQLSDMLVDSMAAKYLYVTLHTHKERRLDVVLPLRGGMQTMSYVQVLDVKQRQASASPFEFNLSWDNLSPRQISILGALGISKNTFSHSGRP